MDDFAEKFKQMILKIPSAKLASGGREIILRCRYCPDSRDPKSAHMYIKVPYNNEPALFNCFKCHTTGIVTHEKLIQWGLYDDPQMLVSMSSYNKNIMKLAKNRKYNNNVYNIRNQFISNNKLSQAKLQYINKRLGTNLCYQDLLDNKIVLNLNDLLSTNNISELTRDPLIVQQLNDGFLGFISQDNAFLNMRRLVKEEFVQKPLQKRYVNYNIFGKFDNTLRYYTLPTKIDITCPERIRLNISEGPFDILSICYNLNNNQRQHCIYSTILGSGYVNIVRHFIINMGFINLEIHIYIDNDISMNVINKLKSILDIYKIPLYLHRNIMPGEKDFGVPLNRIQETITKI